jgi:hypothetical protein
MENTNYKKSQYPDPMPYLTDVKSNGLVFVKKRDFASSLNQCIEDEVTSKQDVRIMLKEFFYTCVRLGGIYVALTGAVGFYLYHRSKTGNSFTGFYYSISGPVPFINLLLITGLAFIAAVLWFRAVKTYTLRSSEPFTNKFLALVCLTTMPLLGAFGASTLFRILFE